MRYLSLIACLIVWNDMKAQSSYTDSICTFTGDIRGLGDNRLILEYPYGRDAVCSDTIRAHHGHFVFTTHLPEPTSASIRAITDAKPSDDPQVGASLTYKSKRSHHIYPVRSSLLLENRSMYLSTSLDSFNVAKVENAPLNDTLRSIRQIWSRLYMQDTDWQYWKKAHPRYWKAVLTAADKAERDTILNRIYQRQEDTTAAFIRSHPSSYAGVNLIWMVHRSDSTTRMALYNAIDSSLRGYPPVAGFKNNIHTNTVTMHHLTVGETAPEISLADTSGTLVSLTSVRGKVTLVDFWASWCGPCRAENPNVVSAYKKYHKKGLVIYSVSLDNAKNNWKAAIQNDKLKWTHVSDLAGWATPYVKTYGVQGIPDNFLLDKNGKIIATNLRGKELESMIASALK